MSRKDQKINRTVDMKEFYLQEVIPLVPTIVRKVCSSLAYYPDQADVASFAQRIMFLLWERNYRILHSFKQESSLETWLFVIAKRHIRRWLRERDKLESLEYLLPDSIIIRPNFDEELLSKERDVQLQEAVQRLTKHDQILVNLWRQGNSIEEIAKEMGIKKRSVSREISAVVKKLKRIFGEASTFVLTLWPFISASYFVCVGGGNGLANQL